MTIPNTSSMLLSERWRPDLDRENNMEAMRPWDSVSFDYPSNVPTMISREEQRYLYWLTSEYWRGKGHVVEMGPWLGGSTVCLAMGMLASPRKSDWKLHVFDSFIWREFMADRYPLGIEVGDSFEPAFLENVSPFRDLVTVNRAVLQDEIVESDSFAMALRERNETVDTAVSWTNGEPVEILFVDGAKSWSGFKQLLETFGPYLKPDHSLIVLQDFKYWGAFWVPAITELLASSLALEHDLRQNTVAFRVVEVLDEAKLATIPDWSNVNGEDCEGLIERAAARLEEIGDVGGAAIVRLSRVRMWIHKENIDRAIRCFERSEDGWPAPAPDSSLEIVRNWLAQETGRQLAITMKSRIRKLRHLSATFPRRLARKMKRSLNGGSS